MKQRIKKSIAATLEKVEKRFVIDLSESGLTQLKDLYIPSLRRQSTSSLQNAIYLIGKEEQNPLNTFKLELLEAAILSRRQQRKSVPVERNYAESPLFSVSPKPAKALVEFKKDSEGRIFEHRKGFRRIQYYGQQPLTSNDFKVFAGLQRMWEIKGREQEFHFHYSELCEVLDLEKEGGNYKFIASSLTKLITTSIAIEDYEDFELKEIRTTTIHNLIQSSIIAKKNEAIIVFNNYLHKGLKENNVIKLNLSIFHDLSSITSKLLYPLLLSVLDEKKVFELDDLIRSLNISQTQRKEVLKQIRESLDDLQQSDVIKEYQLIRVGRSYQKVEIEPSEQLLNALEEGITLSK